MSFANLCVFLVVLFAFATLIFRVVEMGRRKWATGGVRPGNRAPNA